MQAVTKMEKEGAMKPQPCFFPAERQILSCCPHSNSLTFQQLELLDVESNVDKDGT